MLCSQPIPCKACKCCVNNAPGLAVVVPPVLRTPPNSIGWFSRGRAEYTTGYKTEARLQIEAKAVMDDEAALATFNNLRQLDRRIKVEERQLPTRCAELRTRNSTPFRLLDLPAEVRVCIYEYALRDRPVQRLRCFATPALARTSRQLRQECLPVWFAINTFVAEVKSTFLGLSICGTHGAKAEYIGEKDTRYKRLGSLDLDPIVNRLLATCSPSMIRLKNIDFCMLSAGNKRDWVRSDRYAVLSVRDGRPVRVTTHIGGGTSYEYTKHVLHVFEHGKAFLEQLVADPDFRGLWMLQIKEVAAAFRAEAPLSTTGLTALQSMSDQTPTRQFITAKREHSDRDPDAWVFKDLPEGESERQRPGRRITEEFDLPEAEAYFSV